MGIFHESGLHLFSYKESFFTGMRKLLIEYAVINNIHSKQKKEDWATAPVKCAFNN